MEWFEFIIWFVLGVFGLAGTYVIWAYANLVYRDTFYPWYHTRKFKVGDIVKAKGWPMNEEVGDADGIIRRIDGHMIYVEWLDVDFDNRRLDGLNSTDGIPQVYSSIRKVK